MAGRWSKALPVFLGIILPLLIILVNSVWNGNILFSIIALVWIGFAVTFLSFGGPES